MKSRTLRYLIFLLICILILGFLFIPIPRKIDHTFQCTVLDQRDPNCRAKVALTLKGTYTDYLFLTDHYEGQIYLPEYDLYHGNTPNFYIRFDRFHGNLMYVDKATGLPEYPGSFFASEDLESFFLWLMVPQEGRPNVSTGRYFLCYPEMTLTDLYTIIDGK